jgi:O-antigen/teichoic acid export membrane protein
VNRVVHTDMPTNIPETDGLRAQAVAGVAWLGGSRIATQILDQIFTIVLVRILAPSDFGLMSMAMVFTSLVRLFADMGLGVAIIQRRDVDDEYLSTAFWGNLLFGLALCGAVAALSVPVARFFGQAQVGAILAVLALRFVFAGTTATQEAIVSRQMKFGALVIRDVMSLTIGGIIGIVMAVAGTGVWSLVGQALGIFVSKAALVWTVTPWRPRRIFSWAKFVELWHFSSRVLGGRFFAYTIKQTDNLLIGRVLGPALLGYYAYAYGLFLAPLTNFSQIVGRVMFATFARLQDDSDRFRRAFLMTTKHLALVALPAIGGLMLVAPDFVTVVSGDKWAPATPVLRVLLVAGLLQSQATIWMSVFQAKGRADWLLRWGVVSACVYVPAFFIGLRWSIVGVAAGYTISTFILVPVQFWLVQRLVGFRLRDYVSVLAPLGAATGLMLACVLGIQAWMFHAGLGPAVRLVVAVFLGIVSYAGLLALIQRDVIIELRQFAFDLRRPRQRLARTPAEA